jgi:peroxiredoxin
MCRATTRLILGLAWLAFFQGRACEAAEALPRYKLQVGQELKYSGHTEFKYQNGTMIYDSTWRVWVVRKNDDGSWRLVLRSGMIRTQKMNLIADAVKRIVAPQREREDVSFAWCDFYPDGRLIENDSLGYRMMPRNLLAPLPADEAAMTAGWQSEDRRMGESVRCKMLPDQPTADKALLEVVRESPMNVIYGSEHRDTVTFDRQRGLPEKIESYTKQTYGFNGEGQGMLQLDEVQTHDAQWCDNFAADAERYFAASQECEKAFEIKGQFSEEYEKNLRTAIADLKSVRDQLQSDELKAQIDQAVTQQEGFVKYYVDGARDRAALLNQPSAEWTCKDLDGKEHAIKDYRGRVVVLDFWYRGCGWCIRAMPQMKEIASYFADKPVTIFGMNTDRQEEDARFVIDKMGLNYANLKATGVPEKYKVSGFPTLLIIDQEGVIRDIHEGYAPDLKEKVVESIERLLKNG